MTDGPADPENDCATSSDHAGVDGSQLVTATLEHFPTFDGRSISYFLYAKPRENSAGKTPCIVVVHGGPEMQAQPGFSALMQWLALSGYAVAVPNVRGSTGYGKSFSHLDDKEKRLDAVKASGTFEARNSKGATWCKCSGSYDMCS